MPKAAKKFKYFNTLDAPVLYNSNGQTVDGYSWVESEQTPEIDSAINRKELIKLDSNGEFIYDSVVEQPEETQLDPGTPVTPENASSVKINKSEG